MSGDMPACQCLGLCAAGRLFFIETSKLAFGTLGRTGTNFGNLISTPDSDMSTAAPSITQFQNKLYLAWVNSSGAINIRWFDGISNWGNTQTLPDETSFSTPSICGLGNMLYIVWGDTDSTNSLNIMVSLDGSNFMGKYNYNQSCGYAPCISYYGQYIFIGWAGVTGFDWLDPVKPMNLITTQQKVMAGNFWVHPIGYYTQTVQTRIPQPSIGPPALSYPFLAWTDSVHHLNVAVLASYFF